MPCRSHVACILAVLLISVEAGGESVCKPLTGRVENAEAAFLGLVDAALTGWPAHNAMKTISSRAEQLEHWKDTRQEMIVECAKGNEFGAGFALGHAIAMYKMVLTEQGDALIEAGKPLRSPAK
jgi:hypothetical protein